MTKARHLKLLRTRQLLCGDSENAPPVALKSEDYWEAVQRLHGDLSLKTGREQTRSLLRLFLTESERRDLKDVLARMLKVYPFPNLSSRAALYCARAGRASLRAQMDALREIMDALSKHLPAQEDDAIPELFFDQEEYARFILLCSEILLLQAVLIRIDQVAYEIELRRQNEYEKRLQKRPISGTYTRPTLQKSKHQYKTSG